MKKIHILLSLAATLAVICSCSNDNDVQPAVPTEKITVTASTGGTDTRIAFVDADAEGVKLTWSLGDQITFYDASGNYAATFTLDGDGGSDTGTFTMEPGGTVIDGEYTVVYPATTAPTLSSRAKITSGILQTGYEGTDHLDKQCYMSAAYTYNAGTTSTISFVHEYAMITITMEMPDEYTAAPGINDPKSLTFFNGVSSTTLYLDGATWNGTDPIKAYMLIDPCDATQRTLRFDLIDGFNNLYQREVETNKAYLAGKRYVAGLTGTYKLEAVQIHFLNDFDNASFTPGTNTWLIWDAIDESTDLSKLKDAINGSSNNNIRLVMPAATSIGNSAFYDCSNLASISLPMATSIGE